MGPVVGKSSCRKNALVAGGANGLGELGGSEEDVRDSGQNCSAQVFGGRGLLIGIHWPISKGELRCQSGVRE